MLPGSRPLEVSAAEVTEEVLVPERSERGGRGFWLSVAIKLALTWLGIGVILSYGNPEDVKVRTTHPIEAAFVSAGARDGEVEVAGWVPVSGTASDAPVTMTFLKDIASNLAFSYPQQLTDPSGWSLSSGISASKKWVQYQCAGHKQMAVVAEAIRVSEDDAEQPYAVVYWRAEKAGKIGAAARQVLGPLRSLGAGARQTLIISGSLPGSMPQEEWQGLAMDMLLAANAKLVYVRELESGIEVFARNRRLPAIRWNGRAVNIHIRIEDGPDGPQIVVGSPVAVAPKIWAGEFKLHREEKPGQAIIEVM